MKKDAHRGEILQELVLQKPQNLFILLVSRLVRSVVFQRSLPRRRAENLETSIFTIRFSDTLAETRIHRHDDINPVPLKCIQAPSTITFVDDNDPRGLITIAFSVKGAYRLFPFVGGSAIYSERRRISPHSVAQCSFTVGLVRSWIYVWFYQHRRSRAGV